ncbi:cytochrome c oxidase subunit 3 [Pelagibius sp. Alg239-R121]|uniref:cytochrome c oxidase subunit 3 n=1 Tax=Pelagibius sp. Alg239-R121 TaxID=2993448 RepID=UPI0024A63960|nr:cytochrome c oxidase subunit 3 [Pelagibius sp. Alg239-R121]
MTIFHQIVDKPWLPLSDQVEQLHSGRSFHLPQKKLALRFFFAVGTVIFSLLTVSYAERMAYEVWRPLPETWLLWSNAAVLLFSSVAFQRATVCARRGETPSVQKALYAGGFFTLLFLAGQLLSWHQLQTGNALDPRNPANEFFILITGLHGLHLLGGLVVWGRTVLKLRRGSNPAVICRSVELCTAYWHFLFIIWLALFGLLFFPGGSLPIICRAF